MTKIGRLDRKHYWLIVGIIIGIKLGAKAIGLDALVGGAGIALDIFLIGALIARFHDMDLPTWVGAVAGLGVLIVMPIFFIISFGLENGAALVGLTFILTFGAAGCFRGNTDENDFGPTGQGFNGLFNANQGVAAQSKSTAVASRRLDAISGRR